MVLDSGNNLYISDNWNHRILVYSSGSTTATRVYGQMGSFTTGTINKGGISADSIFGASIGLFLDSMGNLYSGEYNNNRVLMY